MTIIGMTRLETVIRLTTTGPSTKRVGLDSGYNEKKHRTIHQ